MVRLLRAIIPVLFFFFILLSWVQFLLTPAFLHIEYRRPGFPPDPYGFTLEERLHWADLSREYLLQPEDAGFFDPYKLEDGSPLYNARELLHLKDVQVLVGQASGAWIATGIVLLVSLGVLFAKSRPLVRIALGDSGRFTFLFFVIAILAVAVLWDSAFVFFHRVFFTGETWLFLYSDTLIRLFPVTFWQDVFAVAAGGTALTGLAFWAIFRKR